MSGLAGVDAPYDGGLVLEDGLGLERNPVAAKRSVACVVFDGNSGRQLLEFLDERAVGFDQEFGQLFIPKVLALSVLHVGRKKI